MFVVVLFGGSAVVHVIRAVLPSSRVKAQPPQTVVSERSPLKFGQAIRYDLVLIDAGRVKIDVRSAPLPVTVTLLPIDEERSDKKRSNNPERSSSGGRPLFSESDTLAVIRVESLTAGKWEILIERSDRSIATRKTETVVTTEVRAL